MSGRPGRLSSASRVSLTDANSALAARHTNLPSRDSTSIFNGPVVAGDGGAVVDSEITAPRATGGGPVATFTQSEISSLRDHRD